MVKIERSVTCRWIRKKKKEEKLARNADNKTETHISFQIIR